MGHIEALRKCDICNEKNTTWERTHDKMCMSGGRTLMMVIGHSIFMITLKYRSYNIGIYYMNIILLVL